MPKTREKPETLNGGAPGYSTDSRAKWRWVEMPEEDTPDGEQPFRAEVRANLTFGQIDHLGESPIFVDIWDRLWPHVRAWNLTVRDDETGQKVAVPPPAEVGPDAFKGLTHEVCEWLWAQARTAHFGGEDLGKDVTSPVNTGETPGDEV